MTFIVLFFSSTKNITQYELKNNNSIAIMLYDEELEEFVKQNSIPVGDYELDDELSYCTNLGKILGYNSTLGTVNTFIQSSSECFFYFRVYTMKFTSQDFPYTGDIQSFTVPATGYYKLEVWGASGGASGGKGGYSTGVANLTKNQIIYVNVGGQGAGSSSRYAAGGWNGGGSTNNNNSSSGNYGGGGATDIRTINGTVTVLSSNSNVYASYVGGTDSLNSRLIVAGGGGGFGTSNGGGGAGGGTSGGGNYPGTQSGTTSRSLTCCSGYSTGHNYGGLGYGGYSNSTSTSSHIVGGGGGYYGGNFGSNDTAGGGSGYVASSLTSASTTLGNTAFTSPSGTSETGHSGNGHARITWVGKTLN